MSNLFLRSFYKFLSKEFLIKQGSKASLHYVRWCGSRSLSIVSHLVKGQLENLKLLGLDRCTWTSSLRPPWPVLSLVPLGGVVLGVAVHWTCVHSSIKCVRRALVMVVYGRSQNGCCGASGANWGLISSVAQLRANFDCRAQFLKGG